LLVLEKLKQADKLIYNLGSGLGFTVREVIDTVRQRDQTPVPAREAERRPGDPAVLVANSEKDQTQLLGPRSFPISK
jgi:UDP-glucose 4-epimerase